MGSCATVPPRSVRGTGCRAFASADGRRFPSIPGQVRGEERVQPTRYDASGAGGGIRGDPWSGCYRGAGTELDPGGIRGPDRRGPPLVPEPRDHEGREAGRAESAGVFDDASAPAPSCGSGDAGASAGLADLQGSGGQVSGLSEPVGREVDLGNPIPPRGPGGPRLLALDS